VTKLPFDYLIVATGSSYPSPMKVDEAAFSRNAIEDAIRNTYEKIKSATRVLVVGGGPVGCEVAAEIAVAYPEKKVTLLEGSDKLVAHAKMTDKFRRKLMEGLVKIKVNVLLGERLPERPTGHLFEASTVTTSKGTVLESDIRLLCAGTMPNVELIRSLDANLIDKDKGSIKVKSNLQLDDDRYAHIYVIGDANNHPTPKLAYTGSDQAKFLANQLARHIKSKGSVALAPYVAWTTEAMLMPLGPHGGVSQLPLFGGTVVGDTMTKMFKSKDYAAGIMWGSWKAKLPST
jgi:NADH dehydrogenase FAD-containing subunit